MHEETTSLAEERVKDALAMLTPVSRTTLSEQVAKRIAAEFEARRWLPGEKLPSEAALCKAFNVGRSTLREALKSLSFVGLIRMVPGDGSYVEDHRVRLFEGSLLLTRNVLSNVEEINCFCEARILVETELAALCAQRATEDDLLAIEETLRQMTAALESSEDQYPDLDLNFHLGIANAARNPLLVGMLKHIRAGLEEFITNSIREPARRRMAHRHHEMIFSAIQARNAEQARKAMYAHLRPFQSYYLSLIQEKE